MHVDPILTNRLVAAVVWAWTAFQLAIISQQAVLILAVPVVLVLGATVARHLTRYAFALAIGLMAASVITLMVNLFPVPAVLDTALYVGYPLIAVLVTIICLPQLSPKPATVASGSWSRP